MENIGVAVEDLCNRIAELVNINVDFLNDAYKFAVYVANAVVNFLDYIFTWLRYTHSLRPLTLARQQPSSATANPLQIPPPLLRPCLLRTQ